MIDKHIYNILAFVHEHGYVRFIDLKDIIGNPRTLSKKLKLLLDKELLIKDKVGYRITDKGVRVLNHLNSILKEIEGSKDVIVNIDKIPHLHYAPVIRKYIELLIDHFKDELLSVVLFGSIARGDWDLNSDIDLLIVVSYWDDIPIWRRIQELYTVRRRLRETIEYKEVVKKGYTPIIQNYPLGKMEATHFHRIYLDIILDGIILYDKEDYINNILDTFRRELENRGARRISKPDGRYYWVLGEIKAGEVFTL